MKTKHFENIDSYMGIARPAAREFWRDLMGTLWGDSECRTTHGTMSAELIAQHMRCSVEDATRFMWACVKFGYSDRANGAFVV